MDNSEQRGRQASVEGFANEHIVAGILMKRYQNVSLVDLPLSPFDIIILMKKDDETEDIIRVQVKTATKAIGFTGGGRGGVDREYISDVKIYRQSTLISDIVIGIRPIENGSYELYFVPTILIENLNQNSISVNKVRQLKDNYEILERCKDKEFILQKAKEYGIIK
ncbi:MAG: hypothetical protein AAB116_18765 [Candidatus Poribacteria bacterium]